MPPPSGQEGTRPGEWDALPADGQDARFGLLILAASFLFSIDFLVWLAETTGNFLMQ